jgi:glycosyltransferase involved in cell wall biosynthesis
MQTPFVLTSLVIEYFEDPHWLGGSIYIDNLLAILSSLEAEDVPAVRLLFLSSPMTPLGQKLLKHLVVVNSVKSFWQEKIKIFGRRGVRAAVRRQPWLNHWLQSPSNAIYFPALDATQRWRRNLYWIPDFQHHYLPDLFDQPELAWRNRNFTAIARSPGTLILSSQAALADFQKFYPNAVVKPQVWSFCSTVNPADGDDRVIEMLTVPPKFLYVANQFWRHKDHATLFEALNLLKQRGVTIPVVCTGKRVDRRDPSYFSRLVEKLDQDGLANDVQFLDVVPRAAQIHLLRIAAAVVQPSLFEGWSTVIEDAKALGRPIIASDFAVHREQLADYPTAWLFPMANPAALAQCLLDIWESLSPGPDLAQEAAAARQNWSRRQSLARQFMAIVNDAMI